MDTARRLLILAGFAIAVKAQTSAGVRLLLGVGDRIPTRWDGAVEADRANIDSLEPWRFEDGDQISGASWRMSSRQPRQFGAQNANRPVVANGVIVRLSNIASNARLRVHSAQGNFEIALQEIPYGTAALRLEGRAFVDRVPPSTRITDSPDEEDYPSAAAGKDGDIWIAYMSFRHHADHDQLRAPLQFKMNSFSRLKEAPGGDQILARRFSKGAWQVPVAITAPGGDLYGTAIAIDGQGRPWVFWSRNNNGNFDIFGRSIEKGNPAREVRISQEAGSDVFPVAATDAAGRVWVAWQGWRAGRAVIFCATQNGGQFSSPVPVSQSSANEWNPAIATDQMGRVSIAWDSYRSGSYDVYVR
jgi:hypothetical protein